MVLGGAMNSMSLTLQQVCEHCLIHLFSHNLGGMCECETFANRNSLGSSLNSRDAMTYD